MNSVLIGFVLLFSPCGKDACEWVPVTERIYPTRHGCQQVADELKNAVHITNLAAVKFIVGKRIKKCQDNKKRA